MALVFGLRLLVLGLGFLAVSLLLFVPQFSSSAEWESLLVLFSVFVILVALVLIFIRFAGHTGRILLLAPLLLLPAGEWMPGFGLLTCLLFLEAFRRESGGLRWFLGGQLAIVIAGASLAFLPVGRTWLVVFWLLLLVPPLFLSLGCWQWQDRIKQQLAELDRDDG